jgi:hypothetical protein
MSSFRISHLNLYGIIESVWHQETQPGQLGSIYRKGAERENAAAPALPIRLIACNALLPHVFHTTDRDKYSNFVLPHCLTGHFGPHHGLPHRCPYSTLSRKLCASTSKNKDELKQLYVTWPNISMLKGRHINIISKPSITSWLFDNVLSMEPPPELITDAMSTNSTSVFMSPSFREFLFIH